MMKSMLSVLLLTAALLGFTNDSKADILITNTTSCTYEVTVGVSIPGLCRDEPAYSVQVIVPPLGTFTYPVATQPGYEVVFAGVWQMNQVYPNYTPPVGLAPCLGMPGFDFNHGDCNANIVFTPGMIATLDIN